MLFQPTLRTNKASHDQQSTTTTVPTSNMLRCRRVSLQMSCANHPISLEYIPFGMSSILSRSARFQALLSRLDIRQAKARKASRLLGESQTIDDYLGEA